MTATKRRPSGLGAAITTGLLLILLQGGLRAQSGAPETFAESIEVDLVTVEVHVTDGDDKPASGLDRDRFSILHDGSPVEITHFVEIRDGKAIRPRKAVDAASPTASDENDLHTPHLIVVFDIRHLTVESQRRLAREVDSYLSSGKVPAERVLLVRLEGGLAIETPFGSTYDDLARALEELGERKPSPTDLAAEVKQVTQALQGVWTELNDPALGSSLRSIVNQVTGPTASQGSIAGDSGGGGTPGSAAGAPGLACDDFVDRVEPIIDGWARRELASTRSTLSRLSDASGFLSGLEGPKTLLYLSDGIGATPGVAATSFVRGLCPAFKTDLEVDSLPEEIGRLFEELAQRASSNRITVHALHAPGLESSMGRVVSQASADTRGIRLFERSYRTNAREGLSLLTEGTGGRVLHAGADLDEALARVDSDLRDYYSLAYTPPPSSDVSYHRIEVQVSDDSLVARHRAGYRDKTTDEWLTERLESALYLGLVDNPLSVRLGAGEITPVTADRSSLPLHVVVPSDRLAFSPEGDQELARVRIRVLTLNAETRILMVTDRSFFLPRPVDGASDLVDLRVDVELGAGNQMLAIAVRDETSGETSFVSTALEIGS